MAALHQCGGGAEVAQGPRGIAHPLLAVDRPAEQGGSLVQVRRDQSGPREEPTLQSLDGVLREQRIPVLRDHHRIDDEIREPVLRDRIRDARDELCGAQGPRLRGAHLEILGHGGDLPRHQPGRQQLHLSNAHRVLRRDERERAGSIDLEALEGLEIGLDPRTPARVGARDGQRDPHRHADRQAASKNASSSSIARR